MNFIQIVGFVWPKSSGGPSDDLGRSFGIIISPKFQNPTMLVNHFHIVFIKKGPKQNHENQTVRESLESKGPRDLPSMKERNLSYTMHGSRAPYDQMAPQLCQFYAPGQPCVMCRYGKLVLCVGTVSLSCVGTVSLSCVSVR